MDPFIEACGRWEDFHPKLIAEIERALAAVLPDRYFVSLGARSYVVLADTEGKDFKPFLPDVGVATPAAERPAQSTPAAVAEAAEEGAVSMEAFIATEFRETFVEIHENEPDERLVTCIEVLSPSNKRRGSEGWERYVRKRSALLLGAASLVELDLLRGGQRMPMVSPWPDSPYTLLVCRQHRAPRCTVWPAHFRKPLPAVPIPLSPPDADVRLDLQALVAAVYARSHYERRLDYSQALKPPPTGDDAAWVAERLQART
jgi:hypothetical protein